VGEGGLLLLVVHVNDFLIQRFDGSPLFGSRVPLRVEQIPQILQSGMDVPNSSIDISDPISSLVSL
jgi:hypothetical protein